jgi:hypothetical protein
LSSGGVESAELKEFIDETNLVSEAMQLFDVDERTARKIINWAAALAQKMFNKWQNNYVRRISARLKKEEKEWKIKMGLASTFKEGKDE